jgi:glycosyltransferase involved in cell wall biosynthesis
MIVKNEEKNIGRALSSVKPVVDEMIVVDTGSTDGTREIARSLGAKVYDHRWKDDFSDARNFALSKATGKWALILDADEVISPLDHKELKGLIAAAGTTGRNNRPVAYTFTTRNYVNEFNVSGWTANDGLYPEEEAGTGWFPGDKVRLFPVDERIHFENAVHERIEPSLLNAGIGIRKCNIPVHHYGMLNKEEVAEKNSYYYNLGKSRIAEKGGRDLAALYDLAVQASGIGKHEEALGYLNEVIAARPDFSKAFASMGNIYYNLRRYEDALSAYGKAIDSGHKSRDTFLMYATCKVLTGNAESVISLLEGMLKNNDEHPRVLLLLAESYFCAKRKEKGMEYMKKLADMDIDAGKYFTGFAKVLMSAGRFDYAVSLFESAVQDGGAGEAGALLAECRKIMKK